MKNLDQKISDEMFDRARGSAVLSLLVRFSSTGLLWIFVVGSAIATRQWILSLTLLFFPWIVTLLIAEIVHRKRPFRTEHKKPLIHLPVETPSFPSAHATIAFAFLPLFVGDVFQFFIACVIAIAVALGRVAVGVHYLTDVIAGAFVGSIVGWMLIIFL